MRFEPCFQSPVRRFTGEITNVIFTSLFLAEMVRTFYPTREQRIACTRTSQVLKIVGLGLFGYLSSRLNVFDGVVVLVSFGDLFVDSTAGEQSWEQRAPSASADARKMWEGPVPVSRWEVRSQSWR